MATPRYPQIEVSTRSDNPLALVAAVREELRRARVRRLEIRRFSREAMTAGTTLGVRRVCCRWVTVSPA